MFGQLLLDPTVSTNDIFNIIRVAGSAVLHVAAGNEALNVKIVAVEHEANHRFGIIRLAVTSGHGTNIRQNQ